MSSEMALRKGSAAIVRGGLKNRPGTLLVYPDRVVHVSSTAAMFGAGFGALGVLVTRGIANARSDARVLKGGTGVTTVPYEAIMTLSVDKKGNRKFGRIVVHTTSGEEFLFAISKVDEWFAAIDAAREAHTSGAPNLAHLPPPPSNPTPNESV
jgi:hypothetical protein